MSHSGKPFPEMGIDSLSDRFQNSSSLLDLDNKPDFRELDLGNNNTNNSPISPLKSRRRASDGGVSSSTTTTNSTSSTKSLSNSNTPRFNRSNANHSKDSNTTASDNLRSVANCSNSKPGHRRSMSSGSPLIYSGSGNSSSSSSGSGGGATPGGGASSVSSPNSVRYPTGNICPSGKILKSNMGRRSTSRTDTLASGTGNYGHGNIVRGGAKLETSFTGSELAVVKMAMSSSDPEEVKLGGNELYKRGNFAEALGLYDRAIAISPENAAYRSNRAAALTMMGRLGEAVRECEEAVRLEPGYGRAHQRLASLYLRLGQVENARHHLCFHGKQPDKAELQKLILLEKHLSRCEDARKIGDWKSALRECELAMVAGAESSPQITAYKAEALLKLHKLENADATLLSIIKLDPYPASSTQAKFSGMLSEAYVLYVQAQVDMAFGRFENAVAAAEKAGLIDRSNIEIAVFLNNVKSVTRARSRGKVLFDSGRFAEACTAYGEGLKYDMCNSVLFCNRAVCWSKLGMWEQSVEDCNQALKIQPNYTKALLRRAVSNAKLERWVEAVRDYEALRRELPGDKEVAESLCRAQVALKKLRQEEVQNSKCGDEVEEVSGVNHFKAAKSSPGVSVVYFKAAPNQQCQRMTPFVDSLSVQFPSVNFLKVDVEESPAVAKAESIRIVPTFNIYKNGDKVREMICPSHQDLESLVRQHSL